MKSSIFKLFATDAALEKSGVWINYGDFKFLVARAGGKNTAYAECLKAKVRPYRYQIEKGTLSDAEDSRITAEVYAETIIQDAQILKEDGSWEQGLPTADGDVIPFTKAEVAKLLLSLPDMFRDLRQQASDSQKYLIEAEESDVKN